MKYIRCDHGTSRALSSTTLQVLLALADSERHGYGIRQEILARTQGAMYLGPGTLYTSIKYAIESGLIEISGDRPDSLLGDEVRRYYRLTNAGRGIAHAELQRLQRRFSRTKIYLMRKRSEKYNEVLYLYTCKNLRFGTSSLQSW